MGSADGGADCDFFEEAEFVQAAAGADGDSGQRVFGQHDGKTGRFSQQDVHVLEARAAADQDDALVDDIRRQFRRRMLQRDLHGLDDGADRLDLALETIAMFNLTTGFFLSQRILEPLVGRNITEDEVVARQKALLERFSDTLTRR